MAPPLLRFYNLNNSRVDLAPLRVTSFNGLMLMIFNDLRVYDFDDLGVLNFEDLGFS